MGDGKSDGLRSFLSAWRGWQIWQAFVTGVSRMDTAKQTSTPKFLGFALPGRPMTSLVRNIAMRKLAIGFIKPVHKFDSFPSPFLVSITTTMPQQLPNVADSSVDRGSTRESSTRDPCPPPSGAQNANRTGGTSHTIEVLTVDISGASGIGGVLAASESPAPWA